MCSLLCLVCFFALFVGVFLGGCYFYLLYLFIFGGGEGDLRLILVLCLFWRIEGGRASGRNVEVPVTCT